MTLRDLKIGESGIVETVGGEGILRQHFLDMGIIPGARVTVVKFAPMGDPVEVQIHGYELTLRLEDAGKIGVIAEKEAAVRETHSASVGPDGTADRGTVVLGAGADRIEVRNTIVPETDDDRIKDRETAAPEAARPIDRKKSDAFGGRGSASTEKNIPRIFDSIESGRIAERLRIHKTEHPYLGEPGIHHDKEAENPLPAGHKLSFALVGNQNCGKTTLFNCLTGSTQHVGNFPGVTVDRKEGAILGHPDTVITDLPGIYSMSPYSAEEIVSRDFVLENRPDAIINILDANNIERNLYLTMQLLQMGRPMVLALNMMDEFIGNGGSIDINAMEAYLGVPVVPISAAKGQGIGELVDHALHVARYQEKPLRQDFCDKNDYGGAVHRCIHGVVHLIEDHAEEAGLPLRFAAVKAIEGDHLIIQGLKLDQNEQETLDHIKLQMERERGLDCGAAIADMRFGFIQKVCEACVFKPRESKEHARSEKLDRILTGKYTAIPMFVGIMGLVFWLTFNVIGAFLQDQLARGIGWLAEVVDGWMTSAQVNPAIHDLIIDGLFGGVGGVLSFLPIVVTMFFFLSLLEDSGYIARVAFFMDKLLRRIGLSGRSIVPMLIGFGCTVPAVMATRILPSDRDRRLTILLTPFMSCTAKLPVYAFLVNAFFPGRGGLIMTGLYLLGILLGILAALFYKKVLFRGDAVPFVMELPNYRLPSLRSTLQLMWEKARDFLQKAFSVILIATVVVWFLQTFDLHLNPVDHSADSIMAMISGVLAPLLAPLGLGDWRIVTGLICGLMAKESMVSVLEVLFGAQGGIAAVLSPVSAGALLIFSLLYTPCVASIAAVKREMGAHWAMVVTVWQCVIAWVCAFLFCLTAGAWL